jgi:hypothetical protein
MKVGIGMAPDREAVAIGSSPNRTTPNYPPGLRRHIKGVGTGIHTDRSF